MDCWGFHRAHGLIHLSPAGIPHQWCFVTYPLEIVVAIEEWTWARPSIYIVGRESSALNKGHLQEHCKDCTLKNCRESIPNPSPWFSKPKCWKLALFNLKKNSLYAEGRNKIFSIHRTWSCRNSCTQKVISDTGFHITFANQCWHFPQQEAVVVINSLEAHKSPGAVRADLFSLTTEVQAQVSASYSAVQSKTYGNKAASKTSSSLFAASLSLALCSTTTAVKWRYNPLQSLHFPKWWGTSHP